MVPSRLGSAKSGPFSPTWTPERVKVGGGNGEEVVGRGGVNEGTAVDGLAAGPRPHPASSIMVTMNGANLTIIRYNPFYSWR